MIVRVLLALSPLTIFPAATDPAGCGCATLCKDGVTPKSAVRLPAAPAIMNPVAKPKATVGEDARLAYRKSDAALDAANKRLKGSRAWYLDLRQRYGAAPLQ